MKQGAAFDLAILDMQMPEMDGLELAEKIAECCPALPLIMLSSVGHAPNARPGLLKAHLTKPIKQSHLCRVLTQVVGERAPASQPEHASSAAPRASLRILLAEDNPINQRVALMLLQRLGYRADAVADGAEALEALRRARYDVVLMDLRMPRMDGLEATRRIMAEWPPEERPYIIAVTADVTQGKREACLQAGMDDFVSKPIDEEVLASALARYASASEAASVPPAPGRAGGAHAPDRDPLKALRKMIGENNPALVRSLLEDYLENTSQLVAEMRAAFEASDIEAVGRTAHTVKSTSALLGFQELAALCASAEASCDDGPPAELAKQIAQIETTYERLRIRFEFQRGERLSH